jgi:hypothetical protein
LGITREERKGILLFEERKLFSFVELSPRLVVFAKPVKQLASFKYEHCCPWKKSFFNITLQTHKIEVLQTKFIGRGSSLLLATTTICYKIPNRSD